MYDILDLLNPKSKFTAKGKYFRERPTSAGDYGAEEFNYRYESTHSDVYRTLFANVQGIDSSVVIRTDDQCRFSKVKNSAEFGFVLLQNGDLCEIRQVERDYAEAPQQVLRLFGAPVSVEYLLRLVAIENPWEME